MKQAYPDLALHFTEGGPRLTDYYDTDWCKWGIMAIKALKLGYSSFLGWNLALDERGGPNIGPFMGVCGGFVTRDSRDGEIRFSGQHKAFEHLASYITPSSTVYPLTTGNTLCANVSQYPTALRDVEGVLIDNGNQKVAVIVNPNATGLQTQIEIGGTLWYAELSAESISTIVAE